MRSGLLILVTLNIVYFNSVQCQTKLLAPKKIKHLSEIKDLVEGTLVSSTMVDFNGDGEEDYIVYVNPISSDTVGYEELNEYWIASDFTIKKLLETKVFASINYRWFVNLDNDNEPEIISALGFEDGVDYSIYDLNVQTYVDSLLFRFNPVLLDSNVKPNQYYWGYPWDVSALLLKHKNNELRIYCSFDHEIKREFAEINVPAWQYTLPVIFFKGKSSQPKMKVETINSAEWLSLEEILRRVRKPQ